MELLPERYAAKIRGVLSCFDRIVLYGTLPDICYPEAMTKYLNKRRIRIFDFTKWAEPLRDQIREHAERLADENGLTVDYIRKKKFRKEDRIEAILVKRGRHPGLVHIFSGLEPCTEYRPRYDKRTGKNVIWRKDGKCLHIYFYFIDPELGLCHLRVPTWAPFRLQFCCNGHSILAAKLRKRGIDFEQRDNAFTQISDWQAAQELADGMRAEPLHRRIDKHVQRYCPFLKHFHAGYHWSFMQVEYALDIVFDRQSELAPIFQGLSRTAVLAVKADNVATFLGRKLTDRTPDEVGNNFQTRIQGSCIRHHMGWAAIKMYDKFGLILRIETVANDVSVFRHYRRVEHRDGSTQTKYASMKRSLYSLPALREVMSAANHRYLEFISTLDDPTRGIKRLDRIAGSVRHRDRNYRGFNFFSHDDRQLFEIILEGGFNISGFRNRHIRQRMPHRSSAHISRLLKRLRLHGLIKKVAHHSKYYLTRLGRAVAIAALGLREFFLVPKLAKPIFTMS